MFNQFNQVMAILECFFAKADKHCNIIFVFNYIICVFSSSNLFGLCQHVIGTLAFFLQQTLQLIASARSGVQFTLLSFVGENCFFDTCHAFVFPTKYIGLPTLHVPCQVCQWSKGDYAKCVSNGAVGQITAVLPDGEVKVAWKDARLHMQESGLAKSLVQITQQQYNEACMNHGLHSW